MKIDSNRQPVAGEAFPLKGAEYKIEQNKIK